MDNVITVGELLDQIGNLPRNTKIWVGVPKDGGGFEPCLCIRNVNFDKVDENCGIILDPDLPYSNLQK